MITDEMVNKPNKLDVEITKIIRQYFRDNPNPQDYFPINDAGNIAYLIINYLKCNNFIIKDDKDCIENKILNEIRINLEVNKDIREKTILFTGIIVSTKGDHSIIPTYILIVDDRIKNSRINFNKFNKAKLELAEAIWEIIGKCYYE
ncbi:MAG: hypothetical protein ACFE95_12380 [Candidatus Hodarchaeota archaeon]